jgi:hypothetical protein
VGEAVSSRGPTTTAFMAVTHPESPGAASRALASVIGYVHGMLVARHTPVDLRDEQLVVRRHLQHLEPYVWAAFQLARRYDDEYRVLLEPELRRRGLLGSPPAGTLEDLLAKGRRLARDWQDQGGCQAGVIDDFTDAVRAFDEKSRTKAGGIPADALADALVAHLQARGECEPDEETKP